MKNAKYVIIAIACICAICAGFFFFSEDNKEQEKELTAIEKVIVRDLNNNYPKTPREVVKFYNKIIKCYYGDNPTEEELNGLVDQMICLLDEDLLLVNPRDVYYNSVVNDIEKYKEENKKIFGAKECASNEVVYLTDEKDDGSEKDELAYVNVEYLVGTNGSTAFTYQQFVLRKDVDARWKILTFYQIKGENSDDK